MSHNVIIPSVRLALAVAFAAGVSACTGDPYDDLADRTESTMKKLTTTLEGIDDRASAEAARPELEKIVAEMKEIQADAEKLGEPPPEKKEELQKRLEEQGKALQSAMMKLAFNAEVRPVLQDIFEDLGKSAPKMETKMSPRSPGPGAMLGPSGTNGMPKLPSGVEKLMEEARKRAAQESAEEGGAEVDADTSGTDTSLESGATGDSEDEAMDRAFAAALGGRSADDLIATATNTEKPEAERLESLAYLQLRTLGSKPEGVVPGLTKLLDDTSPQIRASAAMIVARFGDKAGPAIPKIVSLLDESENAGVAVAALGQLGADAKKAVPALVEKLQSAKSDDVKENVINALAVMGTAARDAIPALEAAAAAGGDLASRAKAAIAQIQAK